MKHNHSIVALFSLGLMFAACSSGSGKSDAGHDGGRDAVVEQAFDDGAAPDGASDADAGASDDGAPDVGSDVDADLDSSGADGDATDGDASSADGHSGDAVSDLGTDRGSSASDDAAEGGLPCPTCGFYAIFTLQNMSTNVLGGAQLRYMAAYSVDIINGSNQPVSLANVKFRYWYTSDNAQWNWQCVQGCVAGMSSASLVGVNARPGADSYLEIAFSTGRLDAFSDTGPILQLLFGDSNFFFAPPSLTNDYSFEPNPNVPDTHLTIYVNDKLVWGVEP